MGLSKTLSKTRIVGPQTTIQSPDGNVDKTLFVSVVNVSKAAAATRAAAEIRKAVAAGYATLRAGHRRWWNSYYVNGSFLSISDTLLESFCEPQRFLLKQCHRQPLPLLHPIFTRQVSRREYTG